MTHFAFNSTQRALVARLCAAVLMAAPAVAQYPDRPLRYIVPQAAGSASDTSARILAHEFTRILGQQVVVDNRPGGGLTIGIEMVVRAAPDGSRSRGKWRRYSVNAPGMSCGART